MENWILSSPRREYDDELQCLDDQLWMLKEIQKDIKNGSARNDKEMNKMANDMIQVLTDIRQWIQANKSLYMEMSNKRWPIFQKKIVMK